MNSMIFVLLSSPPYSTISEGFFFFLKHLGKEKETKTLKNEIGVSVVKCLPIPDKLGKTRRWWPL